MATLANPATANQASFGQFGSTYTRNGNEAIKPPTGKVFVAITFLEDTIFDSTGGLVAEEATVYINTQDAANDADTATAIEGEGGKQITTVFVFPKGVTLYGRWTEIDLNTGSIVAYFSD